ncbi:hypothetical protein JTE90_011104 [Oedothorax gibbosus]|uniref:Uncharacterized protein n=1 Tax=Oedothorax gibbosus TaxID=931172 RepID=A0AAV6U225_9ARAC|nr:hypothetical protein JTE90_011104 [Oedothorax gibbosus]
MVWTSILAKKSVVLNCKDFVNVAKRLCTSTTIYHEYRVHNSDIEEEKGMLDAPLENVQAIPNIHKVHSVEIISRNTVKTSLLSEDTIKSKFQFKQEEGEEMEVDKQIDVQIPITKAKLRDWIVVEIKSIKLLIYHFVGQIQEALENNSFSVKFLKLNRVSETEFVFT